MATDFLHDTILESFIRYVQFDTMSDPHLDVRPTTEGQMQLLVQLEKELKDMGITEMLMDPNGYLIARIRSNSSKTVKPIGFMAHVDVADDVPGNGVKPRVIDVYDGEPVVLNKDTVISDSALKNHAGETIVVSDGTTLLGADDKAGVAILMAVARYLIENPDKEHGDIEFVFTTDEETGGGMDAFKVDALNSEVCYTLDGGPAGEIEAECFNAATMEFSFKGVPYHLGAARGRMVNSVAMASAFISAIPKQESPEATDGRYGYYSVDEIHGTIDHTSLLCYVRDFDRDRFLERITTLEELAKMIERLYPGGVVETETHHSYSNMAEGIARHPGVMESIIESGRRAEIPLRMKVIRGGTDGARLTQMGIPTPNIFTGGHNYHSKYEWLAMSDACTSALLVAHIIEYWAS